MSELYDIMPFEYQITESASGRLRVEGVFQRSDVENANKRVYPRSIWEKELRETRVQDALGSKAMFGELDHPSDGKTSLKRVSHIVTGLKLQEDGTVTGAAEVLETPNGQILKTLFESGAQVGISSRGSGSVQNGVVQEDFKLGTFDFVARPSTPGALPRPSGETKSGATRTEADEVVDKVEVIATDDDSGVRDDIFEKFFAELEQLDTNLCEETSTGDLNAVAEEVITLHNYLAEAEITPEIVEKASGQLLTLGGILTEMAANHPEHGEIIADLLEKVELSRGTIIMNVPKENIKEEPMDKQKLEFIKERLNSRTDDEVVDEQAQEAAELEELRAKLDELSDEELVEVGLEVGAISQDDLEETDDEEPSEADIQNLFDYVEGLEGQLEEAAEIIETMAGALEEAEDVGGITLKYEAALGIIQETVSRFQLLQEAVGGEEKANELMESHLTQLEADEETDEVEEAAKGDETDDGSAVVEEILNEDGEQDDAMSEHLRLFEGAKDRLNLTN
jgi:hypothetical protein